VVVDGLDDATGKVDHGGHDWHDGGGVAEVQEVDPHPPAEPVRHCCIWPEGAAGG
jgi:hypothetical protein